MVSVYESNGMLVVRTPYDPDFVAELKTLPAGDRRFDPTRKVWLITPDHGQELKQLVQRHFGFQVSVPVVTVQVRSETRVLEVRYIGTCKDRGAGDRTAFGWVDGGWNVIFPETILRDWFGQEAKPGEHTTLYGILGLKQDAIDSDLRVAYRRLARQWHPDVCKEPDAAEQFRTIQHAYDVLRDEMQRRRYDAGLKLTTHTEPIRDHYLAKQEFRSPLRCGLILADCLVKLGKYSVGKIHGWEDIVDNRGRTLVTSWPAGADTFEENWL